MVGLVNAVLAAGESTEGEPAERRPGRLGPDEQRPAQPPMLVVGVMQLGSSVAWAAIPAMSLWSPSVTGQP